MGTLNNSNILPFLFSNILQNTERFCFVINSAAPNSKVKNAQGIVQLEIEKNDKEGQMLEKGRGMCRREFWHN